MNYVRRLKFVGAVLALAAIITTAHVWGDPFGKKGGKKVFGPKHPTTDTFQDDLIDTLASNKFASGGVLTYRTTGGETLFALQVKPELKAPAAKPRDYLVMLDTSASQASGPLASAVRLTEELIRSADEHDRIALWTVNTPPATLNLTRGFKSLQAPSVKDALAKLRQEVPLGNTDLKNGLKKALSTFEHNPERQQVILLLGDGLSTYNPISTAERNALCEAMIKDQVTFFTIPVGPRLEPMNLHGLATGSGGKVVRILQKDKDADTIKRLQEALAVPVLYPRTFKMGDMVAESYPTVLPPVRSDTPTLVVGKLKETNAISYTLEGTLGGQDLRLEPSLPTHEAEADNFFLVGVVEQWKKAPDQPAAFPGDLVLDRALTQSQLAREDLIAQAEWALGQDRLDVALDLFQKAKQIDPQDVEAGAGIKVVERLKAGKLSKEEMKKQLAEADKEEGLQKLALAGGGAAQPAGGVPPPPAPAPAPQPEREDLLGQQRARMAVEDQRVSGNVEDALRDARALLRSDPDAAEDLLKRTYAAVRDNPDLSERIRQLLSSRLEMGLRDVATQGKVIKSNREEELRQLADSRRRTELETTQTFEQERTRRRMLQFANLMAQARYEDAYLQALAVQQDAINTGRPVPVAATAAYDVGLVANNLSQLQELKRVREERFLLTLMQVERSHVPFPDEPPIQFPPAAVWRELTRLRKEKYESSGLTEDDPVTLRQVRALKTKLDQRISLEKGIDANTPLKDALEFLSDRYEVTILVDTAAFSQAGQDSVEDKPVRLPKMTQVSLGTVLRLLAGQVDGTYLVRRDYIEITTGQRAVAEKVIRVYPVADLVIPIPNAFNRSAVQNALSIFGTSPGLGLNLGGPQGLTAIGNGLGLGGAGLGGVGLGGLGLGGLGLGGAGLGGLGGLGLGGGAMGIQGGFGGGLGFGGGGQTNLGVGGGQLGLGGGQLGQFGNLGGQFGLQGGDQSLILVSLIRQVVGNQKEWAAPGAFQAPQALGALNPAGQPGNEEQDEKNPAELLNSLGYYPPARALVVKGSSRIHTNVGGGIVSKGPGMARLDDPRNDGKLRIVPGEKRDKGDGQFAKKDGKQDKKDGQLKLPEKKLTDEQLAKLDPAKVWQEALSKGVTDPGLIIACADFLAKNNLNDHLAEFLKADLRLGIVVRPWVYDALALALEASGGSPDEIERARLSAVDLQPQDAQTLVQAAKDMANLKHYDRAVAFCRQAAMLEPNTPYPYEEALVVAELAKDTDAMEWAAGGLLKQDWPVDNRDLQLKARTKVRTLAQVLEHEQRVIDAERLVKAVEPLRQRDLVLELSWQGEGDLELEVKEPIGSACSFLVKQTPGGGILLGDTFTDGTRQTYIASKAFSGDYQVTIRRIWGRPLGGKATLRIIEHQGTAQQTERWETIAIDRVHTRTVALTDGRRTNAEYVPPPLPRKKKDIPEGLPTLAEVQNRLRAIANPELVGSETSKVQGGFASLGLPTAGDVAKQAAKSRPEPVPYQTKLPSVSNNGFDVVAQPVDSPDGGYKLSPVFQSLKGARQTPAVNNPLLPGGADVLGGIDGR
jgi:tetratricopeptide (TPR) repeat protein